MTKSLLPINTPGGVGAGQRATFELEMGYTYDRIIIEMTADVAPAAAVNVVTANWANIIGAIRLKVDGDAAIDIDAGDLVSLNAYYGRPAQDGTLVLYLARPWERTAQGESLTSYGTNGGIKSLILEVELKAGINIGIFKASAILGAPRPFGSHMRIQRYSQPIGAVGITEWTGAQRGNYLALAAHITSASIKNVDVLSDHRLFFSAGKLMRNIVSEDAGRTPQAGYTHIDFQPENRTSEAVLMAVQDFRIKADYTAIGNPTYYLESIQGPVVR